MVSFQERQNTIKSQREKLRPFYCSILGCLNLENSFKNSRDSHKNDINNVQNAICNKEISEIILEKKIINDEITPNEKCININETEMEYFNKKYKQEFQYLIPVIVNAINNVVDIHEKISCTSNRNINDKYYLYETTTTPDISIEAYITRIAEYAYISPSTLVCALILLDRLSGRHPMLLFTKKNIHKIFFTIVRIASKVIELRALNNKNFAPIGGVSLQHLNHLESIMLIDFRFDLYINPDEFKKYVYRATYGTKESIPISQIYKTEAETIFCQEKEKEKEKDKENK